MSPEWRCPCPDAILDGDQRATQGCHLAFSEADEPGADLFFHERCEWVEEVVRPASKKSLLARLARYFRMMLSLFSLRPVWVGRLGQLRICKTGPPACRKISARNYSV